MQDLSLPARGGVLLRRLLIFYLLLPSCSVQVRIPTVVDKQVDQLIRDEAVRIIAVSEDRQHASEYQIFLSDFPRNDILGMSIGNRRIYISHQLATMAVKSSWYRWLLRQTLAHEIAHETAGHATQKGITSLNRGAFGPDISAKDVGLPARVRLYHYSTEKELEADAKGLAYWNKLNWDCRIWVRILENFEAHNYAGDISHPTDKRLLLARRLCLSETNQKTPAFNAQLPEKRSARPAPSA
jgi:predicted Zn-dependent protease